MQYKQFEIKNDKSDVLTESRTEKSPTNYRFKEEVAFKIKHDVQREKLNQPVKRVVLLRSGLSKCHNRDSHKKGMPLILKREPDFPDDRWAIAVHLTNGTKLGYIPFEKNQSVARLMDAGKRIVAFVDDKTDPEYEISRKCYRYDEKSYAPVVIYMEISVKVEEK